MVRSQQGLTVGGFARAGGVGVETVRYYQRRGLLAQPGGGPQSGVRRYGAEDLRRLRFIRSAQVSGFTLAQIAELLGLDASQDRARARVLAGERVAALTETIDQLVAARDALERLARDCARSEPGPCPILAAFDTPAPPRDGQSVRKIVKER